ncbi:MAG: hypothetical protein Q7S53_02670 [bacterium]|nr:hypothetical protein [bacterium]
MLSLEHPAIHSYSRDKCRLKVMTQNNFHDMLGKWSWEIIHEIVSQKDDSAFLKTDLVERNIMFDLIMPEEVEFVFFRKKSITIIKKCNAEWGTIIKTLNEVFQEYSLKPRV